MATYRLLETYPHDSRAFTQGLAFADGLLIEGTGLHGQSSLRAVRLDDGVVLQQHVLPPEFFGEGVTVWRDTVVQLTYQSGVGFVYDRATFQPIRRFAYEGDGWGLTHDGRTLIMSDGSSQLRFINPMTFREVRRITVRDGTNPVPFLNELEYVNGLVLANVWPSQRIACITPVSGRVLYWLDLTGIMQTHDGVDVDVLNGIAYDPKARRLFVTGKRWPKLFQIAITAMPDAERRTDVY